MARAPRRSSRRANGAASSRGRVITTPRPAKLMERAAGSRPRLARDASGPGRRQHDGVVVAAIELGDARLDVAVKQANLQARVALTYLRCPAQAGRADDGARRHVGERAVAVGDERVARILPRS